MMNKEVLVLLHIHYHENQLLFQQLNLEYQLYYNLNIFLDKQILHLLNKTIHFHLNLFEILIYLNIEQENLVHFYQRLYFSAKRINRKRLLGNKTLMKNLNNLVLLIFFLIIMS